MQIYGRRRCQANVGIVGRYEDGQACLSKPDRYRGALSPQQSVLDGSQWAVSTIFFLYAPLMAGRSSSPASDDAVVSFISSTAEYVRKFDVEKSGKDLGTFVSLSRGNEDKIEDVFGVNLPRLRKLKAKYDPNKIWCKAYVIEPDFS